MIEPASSPGAPLAPSLIRIRLLGPVAVDVGGAPLAVDTRKATALLAYLAVTRRPASREAIAALLWPDADGTSAHGALRRTLSVLRTALGNRGLVVDRSAVQLDPSAFKVDIWTFEDALAAARGHEHSDGALCPSCGDALRRAAELDLGEFMAGFALRDSADFDDWQVTEAAVYRRQLASVLERLARGDAAARAWASAAPIAYRWLALDPLHEPAHQLLMEVLARSGEPAAALAQYRDCARILERELGVTPLSATTSLADDIRAGRLTDPAAASSASVASANAADDQRREALPAAVGVLPMVGRDGELAQLVALWEATSPVGRLLLVEGEGGIGKSRLASALVHIVRSRGGSVLAASAYQGEAGIAFSPIASLIRAGLAQAGATDRLRQVPPDLLAAAARLLPLPGVGAAPTPGPASDSAPYGHGRLLAALCDVVGALAAGPVPGLVWLDDAGWIDASSMEFLAYFAHRLADKPVVLLLTTRPEELDAADRRRLTTGLAPGTPPVRIELGRLSRSHVAALVTAAALESVDEDRADGLYDRSEGLPLFVVEALATGLREPGSVPDGVAALLGGRLDSVGELTAQVLAAAAVIGRSFGLQTVRAASGRSEGETVDALDEAMRRGLVRELDAGAASDIRYDFTHGTLRDIALGRLSLARRRLLHGRVAAAIADAAWGDGTELDRWSLIALHETAAGKPRAASDAHVRAGRLARSVFANAEARDHLEAALELGNAAEGVVHEALGDVLTLLGDYDAALGHLGAASAHTPFAERAAIEHRIGLVFARRGDWASAEARLASALEQIAPDRHTGLRSRVLADRGAVAHRAGDVPRAVAFAQDALDLAADTGDPLAIAHAERLLGIVARGRGDLSSARSHLERSIAALDAAETTGVLGPVDVGARIAILNVLALVRADQGEPGAAMKYALAALTLCERQGDRHRQAAIENNLADLLQAQGRHDEALEHQVRAMRLFTEVGGRPNELEPEIWKLVEW